jgi:hypothetical protein
MVITVWDVNVGDCGAPLTPAATPSTLTQIHTQIQMWDMHVGRLVMHYPRSKSHLNTL